MDNHNYLRVVSKSVSREREMNFNSIIWVDNELRERVNAGEDECEIIG